MRYKIVFAKKAKKELQAIDIVWQVRIVKKLELLSENYSFLAKSTKKLMGREENYRLRVGKYRVIFRKEKKILLILVLRIAHRRDVYRL